MSRFTNLPTLFETAWSAPSNIALIKYWGKKKGFQLPANASLSVTLENSRTITQMKAELIGQFDVEYLFEDKVNEKFQEKVKKVILTYAEKSPELLDYKYQFKSSNTFPHSTGIASSASSMAALALCLLSLRQKWDQELDSKENFFKEASHWARLGSGSAARSVFPGLVQWGIHNDLSSSSDEHAIGADQFIGDDFLELHDSIIIVDEGEKSVSSRAGHALMDSHPMRERRFELANQRLSQLLSIIKNSDWTRFIDIIEVEALELHSLMMTSSPSFILMKPNTLAIISELREFREKQHIDVGFTLDAGPNLHVIYPKREAEKVKNWLSSIEKKYHLNIIHDQMGFGAREEKLK